MAHRPLIGESLTPYTAVFVALAAMGCNIDTTKPGDGLTVPVSGVPAIAFASDREGDFDLFLSTEDGSVVRRLTDSIGLDAEPSWSPDGTALVFVSDRDHTAELYTLTTADLSVRRLTSSAGQKAGPAWSPDGSQIAFVSDREGSTDIFVVSADGGEERRLTEHDGADLHPAWSPDGLRIAYSSDRDGTLDIFEMETTQGDVAAKQLVGGNGADGHPMWSPGGRWLSFVSDRSGDSDVYRIPADSLAATPISVTFDSGLDGFRPAWSADGQRIAFVSNRIGDNYDLYVAEVSARELAMLPSAERLIWSDDGNRFAMVSESGVLSVSDRAEGAPVEIMNGVSTTDIPRWSPDGQWLAFTSAQDGRSEVYALSASATVPLKLSEAPSEHGEPSWSRRGHVAFTAGLAGDTQIMIARILADSQVLVDTVVSDSLTIALGSNTSPRRSALWSPAAVDTLAFIAEGDGAPVVYVGPLITAFVVDTTVTVTSVTVDRNEISASIIDSIFSATDTTIITTDTSFSRVDTTINYSDAPTTIGDTTAVGDTTITIAVGAVTLGDTTFTVIDTTFTIVDTTFTIVDSLLGPPIPATGLISWSPDGKWLALQGESGPGELALVRGGDPAVTVPGLSAYPLAGEVVWGGANRLVFVSDATGDRDIFLLELPEGRVRNLTDHPADDSQPSWSSGGDHLAFVSNRDGPGDIYAIRLADGFFVRLTGEGAPMRSPRWWPSDVRLIFSANRGGSSALLTVEAPDRVTTHPARDWSPAWTPGF